MREDLRRFLRGEAVADFIQSDLPKTQQSFPVSEIPPIQKSFQISAQNSLSETVTVVRPAPSFGQNEKRKISNVWMYATLTLIMVSVIGLGVYFLAIQSNPTDSITGDRGEISARQLSNKSENLENLNVPLNSNSNLETPTPIPTPDKAQLQKKINQYISTRGGNGKFKKVFYGDLDHDGDEDAVAEWGYVNEGGSLTVMLTVFRNNKGVFELAASEGVAGSGWVEPEFSTTSIKAGKIQGYYDRGDGEKKNTQFSLKGNKLVEVKR